MNVGKAIKQILKNDHKTQTELCKELGVAKTTLNTQIINGSVTTNTLLKIMNALGYEIVLRPKGGSNKAERSIVINEIYVKPSKEKKSGDQ